MDVQPAATRDMAVARRTRRSCIRAIVVGGFEEGRLASGVGGFEPRSQWDKFWETAWLSGEYRGRSAVLVAVYLSALGRGGQRFKVVMVCQVLWNPGILPTRPRWLMGGGTSASL